MKVKEFSNYRAPRRRPWVPVVVLAFVIIAIIGFLRRPKRAVAPDVAAPPVAAEQVASSHAGTPARPSGQQPVAQSESVALPNDVSVLMQQAEKYRAANQLQPARELYQRALLLAKDDATRAAIEQPLGAIHIDLLFSPRPMPEKTEYAIQRGDQLRLLARRHGTTVELIQRGNNIPDADRIRIGQELRIFTGKFHIVANKSRRDMVVYLDDAFFKRYRVGTGAFGKTPVGTFVINEKLVDPSWWPPDGREVPFGHPDNILGTRWLSIQATGDTPPARGYGIHGTWAPESIGREESAGCIRMHNEQVEELYVYLPVGTPVTIVD